MSLLFNRANKSVRERRIGHEHYSISPQVAIRDRTDCQLFLLFRKHVARI